MVSLTTALFGLSLVASSLTAFVSPPYYPAPHGGWTGDWTESYAKAKALVDVMTLAEKTNITSGTGIFMGMHFCLPLAGVQLCRR
jgi:beta-glucosidase